MATDIPRIHKWWQQPSPNNDIMSNFMPFVPSDLSANAQPSENAINEQTDRWTDRQTNNNIHKHPWMLSVSHLDTSACQIVGHFFQALCMQYTNPSPWMVGRTDEPMKWQQYSSASMLATGKSSGNICISNSMPFLPSDLSANAQKPENVVNRPIDGQTDGQTDGQKSGRGALLLGGIAMPPPPPPPPPPQLGLGGKCDKKWKFKIVEKITSFSDAVTLTFNLRPWKVNQVRTLSLPMCIPNLRTIHPVVFELSR